MAYTVVYCHRQHERQNDSEFLLLCYLNPPWVLLITQNKPKQPKSSQKNLKEPEKNIISKYPELPKSTQKKNKMPKQHKTTHIISSGSLFRHVNNDRLGHY